MRYSVNKSTAASSEVLSLNDNPQIHTRLKKCAEAAAMFNLTPREYEVLWYLSKGNSAQRIARALTVTTDTVKTHTRHIYNKTGVHKRQALIDLIEQMPIDK